MAPRLWRPISGIERGSRIHSKPYNVRGKFHHRQDLLFKVRWGREPEAEISRTPYPQGSTLKWQKDAGRAWRPKDDVSTDLQYKYNEMRYLAPALRASDSPAVRSYLMRQLDPGGRSGIGLFNVRWSKYTWASNEQRTIGEEGAVADSSRKSYLSDSEIEALPDGIPKHIVSILNVSHSDTVRDLLNVSCKRQK